jgi:hypothetical protein
MQATENLLQNSVVSNNLQQISELKCQQQISELRRRQSHNLRLRQQRLDSIID